MENPMYEIYKLSSKKEYEQTFPPATTEQIESWERLNNAVLPKEYKEWLLLSDGLVSHFFGGKLFSLDKIIPCPYPEELKEYSDEQRDYFIIGNYLGDGFDLWCDGEGNFYKCGHRVDLLCDTEGNFYEFDNNSGLAENNLYSFLKYHYE